MVIMNKHLTETEFYHKSHIEILSNHFLENDWVWLYKKYYESSDGVERYHKYVSYLATPISAAFSLKTPNTDIQDDVRVALMGDYTYRPFAKPGFENLVTVRDFKVSRTYYKDIRIAEELIYYFNLFESKEENGDTCYYKIENDTKKLVCLINKSDYPFMHLLYSQLLVCQRVCLQNTVCLICK